ncbi:hypothetical protein HZA43_02100 [Candidatus Peregrinibacteria bacterium]|nr:hypothetical protein [Candidatus Peregrinibacteria bacterium]
MHCVQCSTGFTITPEEIRLRERIASTFETGPVPSPTLCPDCRMQRRMARRNERTLYRRSCDKSGKKIISVYPEGTPFPVYERSAWWSDAWDPLSYGRDFNFNRLFFEQFEELQKVVPRPALSATNSENSDYCNFVFDSRNCYLSHNSYYCDSLLYCYWSMNTKDCIDCNYCFKCERCFECSDCNHSYNCNHSILSHNCSDSAYLYDCRGCSYCFGCVGLRQKSYYIFNQQLTKEEYEIRIKQFDLNNLRHAKAVEERMEALEIKHPHLYSIQEKTEECTGDYIFESKNCQSCFQIYRSQDCMYVQDAETKDALDCYHPGWNQATYECYSPVRQTSTAFCSLCWDGSDNFYSDNCHSCSYCFGCIGLRHKKYCILNKQYSKEKYKRTMARIVARMKETKEWGEFFPVTLSPFAYNESMAQEYYPLSKTEVQKRGWAWRDPAPFTPGNSSISWDKIPQAIQEVPDTILNEVLSCTVCKKSYKIIQQEFQFYRQNQVAIPRECPECRYKRRAALHNARKLYSRACAKCSSQIQTTYSTDRPEIVYCEHCYLKTVY